MKKKIRRTVGIKQFYWDHTKNYSEEMKYEEDKFINSRAKHHSLKTFLNHYIKKPSSYSFLNKIVRKILKKEKPQLDQSTRMQLWLLFSGAAGSIIKHPGYYLELDKTLNDVIEPTKGEILKDVNRTKLANKDPVHKLMLTRVLVNYAKRNCVVGYCQG
jgi:hypothetical protein